jgi:hypothetical protein
MDERRLVELATSAVEFNAMCEGLANAELRGGTMRALPRGEEERIWREAFETVVRSLTRRV